jgi:DNA-binding NarL/FixJ family response regulator
MTTTAETTILLVDEHLLFREALKKLLEEAPGFAVVAHVADPHDAARAAVDLQPDVILTGLAGRPLMLMMRMLQELTAAANPVRTLVLTTATEPAQMVRALQLGASGILSRASSSQLLFTSIRCVRQGQYWVGDQPVADLSETLRRLNSASDGADTGSRFGLTRREQEILAAVGRGESNKTIAERFSIAEDTVKHHLTHVFDKTGVSSRLELAIFAMHQGLVSDRPAQ